MSSLIVLTVVGADRPGVVESLSRVITAHGGNWLESRMARLAGRFAGILQVSVPEANATALSEALQALEAEGLRLTVLGNGVEGAPVNQRAVTVELMGQDHPGIVRDLSHALAASNVNIDELETSCSNASWSGESMFHATARLRLPEGVSLTELQGILEALAKDLMVDITVDDAPSAASR
jgi:glycine cleavage system regulatory protein